MLSWLNLGAAWWLLLIPALIALYVLRQRSERRRVSSLRLWQSLPQVQEARPKLRMPPLSLLLLLQGILLLLGAFALMQPTLTAPIGRHLTLLIDASGSMQAQQGNTTRIALAKDAARQEINNIGSRDQVTVLQVASAVSTICANCDAGAARSSLDKITAGAGTADIRGGLGIAADLAERYGQSNVNTVLISDGAFDSAQYDLLPGSLHFTQVGSAVDNRAITVISARQAPNGTPNYSVYARVENFGAASANIQVTALADTVPQPNRNVTLPAGGHADLIWQLPAGASRFTASIGPTDVIAADNSATLMLPDGNNTSVWVSVPNDTPYMRALSALPGVTASNSSGAPNAAIAIVEGALPDPLPAAGIFLIAPTATFLPGDDGFSDARPLAQASSHPLLQGVDLQALSVTSGRSIKQPAWLQTIVDSAQGPLLLAGQYQGRRIAVLTFDPSNSNLTKLAAFPLLIANVVDWLYPLAGTEALSPGDEINLAPATQITTPDGRSASVGDAGVFADTNAAGIYQVASNSLKTSFAVNMTNAEESAAKTAAHPELEKQAPAAPLEQLTQQQFWSPLAAIALILLSGEWLYYCFKRGRA